MWPEERLTGGPGWPAGSVLRHRSIGAGLGMRQGEILGVSVDDFDEDEMVLRLVRQIRIVDRTLVFAPPRATRLGRFPYRRASGRRFGARAAVPVRGGDAPVARSLRRPVTVRLLVTGEGGRLYSGDLFSKMVWQGAFRQAEIDLARSDVTGCTRSGTSTPRRCSHKACRSRSWRSTSGHADPGFTLRTYTHLVPSSHERARVAIDGVFGRPDAEDGLEAA